MEVNETIKNLKNKKGKTNDENDLYKIYKLICVIYDTYPYKNINWEFCIKENLPKIKMVLDNLNLSKNELELLDGYLNEKIIRNENINLIINKIKNNCNLKTLKEGKNTFTSYTKKYVPLFVDFVGASISDKECAYYINEIYQTFNDYDFIKIDINSSKDKIKFFLKQVTNYVIFNEEEKIKYNHNHIGFIHSYFIQKGWTNIYKTMEIFLRNYYFNADITYWYINENIKRKNRDTIEYKISFNDDSLFNYLEEYKKDLMYRLKLAKKYNKDKIKEVLLAEKDFYLTCDEIKY